MAFDPQLAIDAAFDEFGESVTLRPDGDATIVTGVVMSPDLDIPYGTSTARSSTSLLDIRVADATLEDRDVVLVGGVRKFVMGPPEYRDARRLVARYVIVPE